MNEEIKIIEDAISMLSDNVKYKGEFVIAKSLADKAFIDPLSLKHKVYFNIGDRFEYKGHKFIVR